MFDSAVTEQNSGPKISYFAYNNIHIRYIFSDVRTIDDLKSIENECHFQDDGI